MKITKYNILKAALLGLLATNVACAENPVSPLAVKPDFSSNQSAQGGLGEGENQGEDGHSDEDHLELMALKFEGRDPFGKKCVMYVSGTESDGENGHEHRMVAKVGYAIHGTGLLDSVIEFRRYNIDNNTYYAADSTVAGATPVMVSATLSDEDIVVDYNNLLQYEQQGLLIQSLRADLSDIDMEAFESSLDEVLENNATFADNQSALNQMERLVIKIRHNGHYDAAACSGFSLTGMEEVDFELDGDAHDDHDGDHDHDHDGDHDDDHDDEDDDDHDHDHDH